MKKPLLITVDSPLTAARVNDVVRSLKTGKAWIIVSHNVSAPTIRVFPWRPSPLPRRLP